MDDSNKEGDELLGEFLTAMSKCVDYLEKATTLACDAKRIAVECGQPIALLLTMRIGELQQLKEQLASIANDVTN